MHIQSPRIVLLLLQHTFFLDGVFCAYIYTNTSQSIGKGKNEYKNFVHISEKRLKRDEHKIIDDDVIFFHI